MIPADVAKSLQVAADSALRPVAREQDVADRLSGLVAGQKVVAQIQAIQPNGTYRAIINQRNITLALPFSAKSGDSLELLVTESDGKLALAVVDGQGESAESAAVSVRTTLSRTGQLIGTLLSEANDGESGTAAVPLKGNQPIATTPISAQELLPQLKQAITQSGMFYEAHQAEWVEGRFAKSALLQEPQGRLSAPQAFADEAAESAARQTPQVAVSATQAGATQLADDAKASNAPRLAAESSLAVDPGKASATQTAGQIVAPQAQALVQQQLEALATQNFSWQGQVWPGQDMRWEIDEDASRAAKEGDETAARWSTRLHLKLPTLGEVDARIRLQGNQITLSLGADNAATRDLMRAAGLALRSQLGEAGIALASMGVADLPEQTSDGQAQQ